MNVKTADHLNIQTLTTMLLGHKRPDYLHKIGRLVCALTRCTCWRDAIEQQTPFFSDYF